MYSHAAERCTAQHARSKAKDLHDHQLILWPSGSEYGFPFSGDMLAMVKRGTRARLYRRKQRANADLNRRLPQ